MKLVCLVGLGSMKFAKPSCKNLWVICKTFILCFIYSKYIYFIGRKRGRCAVITSHTLKDSLWQYDLIRVVVLGLWLIMLLLLIFLPSVLVICFIIISNFIFKGQTCIVCCGLAVLTSPNRFSVGTYLLSIFLELKDS